MKGASSDIALIIAARMVEALQVNRVQRHECIACGDGRIVATRLLRPFVTLATDPGFGKRRLVHLDARVERVRNQCGRSLSVGEDEAECRQVWLKVSNRLYYRYIRALRSAR